MGVKYTFPKPIKDRCHGALNAAKALCNSVGISTAEKSGSVKVVTRPGTRKYPNGWAWYEPINRQYVMMITEGGPKNHTITIATDPADVTKGWRNDALDHEMCHVFIERNHGEYGHNGPLGKKLKGKVFGWK